MNILPKALLKMLSYLQYNLRKWGQPLHSDHWHDLDHVTFSSGSECDSELKQFKLSKKKIGINTMNMQPPPIEQVRVHTIAIEETMVLRLAFNSQPMADQPGFESK